MDFPTPHAYFLTILLQGSVFKLVTAYAALKRI
jgi:hypothetical protein